LASKAVEFGEKCKIRAIKPFKVIQGHRGYATSEYRLKVGDFASTGASWPKTVTVYALNRETDGWTDTFLLLGIFLRFFSALHGMPVRTSDEKGVHLSIRQMRALW